MVVSAGVAAGPFVGPGLLMGFPEKINEESPVKKTLRSMASV